MTAFAVFAAVAVALLAYAHLVAGREGFDSRFQVARDVSTPWVDVDPRQGTALCPYGATGGRWHTVGGQCCAPGSGACVPPAVYQTAPPAHGERVCPPGTTWGWGLLGSMCCGPSGCVAPRVHVRR